MKLVSTLTLVASAAAATPFNQREGLLPAHGAWRGTTTIDDALFDHLPIHLFRGFKRWSPEFDQTELDFINSGGIYFYALQPKDWAKAYDGSEDSRIEGYVTAIKGVAPAKVMVVVGYEPDGHASDIATNTDVFGSAAEYRSMYRYYIDFFAKRSVTNVMWIMDYSCNVRSETAAVAEDLWPGDEVQWLFFNLFQKKDQDQDGGNCADMLDQLYSRFSNGKYDHIPWGLGAWGTMNQTYGSKDIPTEDRVQCIQQVQTAFNSGNAANKYPKLKASVYFNSLSSTLSSTDDDPALVEAFRNFQNHGASPSTTTRVKTPPPSCRGRGSGRYRAMFALWISLVSQDGPPVECLCSERITHSANSFFLSMSGNEMSTRAAFLELFAWHRLPKLVIFGLLL